ncbi:hypothetical protein MUCCIDRAFT_115402 [Mucor lusitanicus CBS 277.49]|uniref:Tc1-like transposase DDE domain-containing protein n=1 Tax=Mucor lusitanicus CBS 277.49 TaxID=747725 RepID=A0A168H8A4_MUCCL|nr:hypothetical protein MUCCIDRAFT_115402 [Mucor lusitanicus CBS 277.49]
MLWGCFWAGGFGPLVFVDGSMNQDAHVNLLAKNVPPWFINLREQDDREFIFQEDGVTCHIRGPDLNPIEHVWASCLERIIGKERARIKDPEELKAALFRRRLARNITRLMREVGRQYERSLPSGYRC